MQISRFIRINSINNIALRKLKEDYTEKEDWLLAYDCYQMEIIELASIIEVIFRDYFEALIYVCNSNIDDKTNQYIKNLLRKNNLNDFLNIEKANNVYKKAFGINIKNELNFVLCDYFFEKILSFCVTFYIFRHLYFEGKIYLL